jgi:hypothetical protein
MFKFILWVRLMRLIIFLKHRRAVLIYLFFGRTGVWTQVFVLSKQALYCLNHTSSLFCSAYFGGEGGGLQNYLSRLASNHTILDLSLLTSRFIGMSHQYLAAFFFFFFVVSTGVWTQGLLLHGRNSTTWATPPALVSFLMKYLLIPLTHFFPVELLDFSYSFVIIPFLLLFFEAVSKLVILLPQSPYRNVPLHLPCWNFLCI